MSLSGVSSLAGLVPSPSNKPTNSKRQNIVRRSGNYKPTLWDYDYLQSLQTSYTGEAYVEKINKLKGEVRMMLEKKVAENPLAQLEQIDALYRLGISYHFQDEIKGILNIIHNNTKTNVNDALLWKKNDVYATALEFKLLRMYGYTVHSEVFSVLKDEIEQHGFKASLCEDVKGMLSLYEASFYSFKGEIILDEARDFTTKHLQNYVMRHKNKDQSVDDDLVILVEHALELPMNWRMMRLEARWFIDEYSKRHDMNPTFLELAKLDFNFLQSTYQEDLKHVSMWWNTSKLGQKLPFCRDRLVEVFLLALTLKFEAEFGYARRLLTKIGIFATLMDDIYDVYGTLDELKLLEDAIKRWNINELDQLPEYMKIFFVAMYNVVNEIAYDVLKENGILIIKYLKRAWLDLCKCYMVEANWYYSGYTPSLEEYIENGRITISIPSDLMFLYSLTTSPITEESMEGLLQYPTILLLSGTLFRLVDDLATSSDELQRGDNPKSIQCYMHESGVCENDSREYIKNLISETWKQMNEARVAKSPLLFPQAFDESAVEFVRGAMLLYEKGDSFGTKHEDDAKDKLISLFFSPIPTP